MGEIATARLIREMWIQAMVIPRQDGQVVSKTIQRNLLENGLALGSIALGRRKLAAQVLVGFVVPMQMQNADSLQFDAPCVFPKTGKSR